MSKATAREAHPTSISATDFFATSNGGSRAERLAEYDRAIARVDAELKLLELTPSVEFAQAMLSPKAKELP